MTYSRETHTVHRDGNYVRTQLIRIANKSASNKQEVFTSLYHLLNDEMLNVCFQEIKGNKALGIDEVTKSEYEENLNENIKVLVQKLRNHSYKPQPVKRVYIPKANGEKRPLGIPCFEDKLVQMGLNKILNAVFEPSFLDLSYGFRNNRSCHDALRQLNGIIRYQKINYIVDADIKGFFNNVNHEWMIKFIEHRIKDPNITALINKMLKAGIVENGLFIPATKGMPQGSIVSPILSNIYLHYVLDTWFDIIVRKTSDGTSEMIRYADDFVCCFKYEGDSRRFLNNLKFRLKKFGLELAEDKTRTIIFGQYARERISNHMKKPETFDFLGFTHYCKYSRKNYFTVRVKTSAKKYRGKLKGIKSWIYKAVHVMNTVDIIAKLNQILRGYYNYYCVKGNSRMVGKFYRSVIKILHKWLNRRSQRRSYSWKNFNLLIKKYPIISPKIHISLVAD